MDTPQQKVKPRGLGEVEDDPKRIDFSATAQKRPHYRPNHDID